LTPETQKLVESQLKSGRFSSADDVVRFALQTLDELRGDDIEDLDEQTQAALSRAFEQSARGEGRTIGQVRQDWDAKIVSR
jgi:putative addiction module CopG family antidote